MKAFRRIGIFVSTVSFLLAIASAQTNPNLEIGFKPYGSYDSSPIDSVTITNGNLFLNIPLFEYPQRGDLKAQVRLVYNSKGWKVHFDCTQLSCIAWWIWAGTGSYSTNSVALIGDTGTTGVDVSTWTGPGGTIYDFTRGTVDGATHQLAQDTLGGYRSIDATGIYFNDPAGFNGFVNGNFVALDRGGNGYNSTTTTNQSWKDTNGNYFSSSSQTGWTDTLGRSLLTSANDGSGTTGCSTAGLLPVSYAYMYSSPAPNGGTRLLKLCFAHVQGKTYFNARVIDPVTGLMIKVAEANTSSYVVPLLSGYKPNRINWLE